MSVQTASSQYLDEHSYRKDLKQRNTLFRKLIFEHAFPASDIINDD